MDNNRLSPPPPIVDVEPELPETMDFYTALKEVAKNQTIRRASWPQEDYALMADSFLCVFTKGQLWKWNISDGDMEGTDYIVIVNK